jgi:colicin import membrane protein
MTMASSARTGDRVLSISLSVLVHAAILGGLLYGWWQYHTPKTVPPSLAIQATVVRNAPPTEATAPTPPPVDAAALARQQAEHERAEAAQRQAAQEAAERAAAAKAAQVAAEAAEASRRAQEAQRQAEEQAAEREAQLAAERKAAAARKAKEEAELKAKQDAQREQQRLTQQLQAEQAERQREADLRSQVQAEEHLQALQSSPALAQYKDLIQARISRAWIRPPSAREGVHCIVHLTQIPGGEITHVSVENCNGDDALRQSVETAAYRASPLPAPPDPALFDPNLTVEFAPDD